MTGKATVIRLPKGTLVTFERKSPLSKEGRVLERVVYLDRNNNGLDAGDSVFDFHYAAKRSSAKGCIFGCDNRFPRTEIHRRSLTARDVRGLRSSFRKRFLKLVRTAGAHRPYVKRIPKITRAVCNGYWKIVGRKVTAMEAISPVGKSVRFSRPVTARTEVNMQAFGKRSPRIPYDVRRPKPVDPASCRAISTRTTILIGDRRQAVRISAGAPGYPIWLTMLFGTLLFKSKYQNYLARVGVDYMFGGNRYIHLALNDPARLACVR